MRVFKRLNRLASSKSTAFLVEKFREFIQKIPFQFNISVAGTNQPSNMFMANLSQQKFDVMSKEPTSDNRMKTGFLVSPQYRAPRNPVVLCHGLFGFDSIGPEKIPAFQINYWRGIDKALKDLGCQVLITRVPSTGSISHRAQHLNDFLERNSSGQSLNLVAHSMGGLDCRYLISQLRPTEFTIKSLTTVATPHRGSSFMDWCKDSLGLGYIAPSAAMSDSKSDTILKRLTKYIDTPAYHDLTTNYCQQVFNPSTPDDPNCYYSSYAACTQIPVTGALWFSQQIVTKAEGVNDGLVSIDSAKWGHLVAVLDCDHWDLVPTKAIPLDNSIKKFITRKINFDTTDFYLSLVTRLHEQGF